MRKIYFVGLLIISTIFISCAPVTISKCITDYTYDGDKVRNEYTECIGQTPEKMPPIQLKHQELYE